MGMPLTSWVTLHKSLSLSEPLISLSVKWSYLLVSLGCWKTQTGRGLWWYCDGKTETTRIHGPQERLVLPSEDHTREQLITAGLFGFSLSQCLRVKTYKTNGSQYLVISQECPASHCMLSLCRSVLPHIKMFPSNLFPKSLIRGQVIAATSSPLPRYNRSNRTVLDPRRWVIHRDSFMSWDWRASGINWTMQTLYYNSLIELICKYVYWANWVFWQ
jgi:hypothetical protein